MSLGNYIYPHLPVPYIFGTRGRSLPNILATGSQRFQIYRELEDEGIYIYTLLFSIGTGEKKKNNQHLQGPLASFQDFLKLADPSQGMSTLPKFNMFASEK